MIYVIGLGSGKEGYSVAAQKLLKKKLPIYVRTAKTAAGGALKEYGAEYLDDFFCDGVDFTEVNEKISKFLIGKAALGDLIYCVDGDGYSDGTVMALTKKTSEYKLISAGGYGSPSGAVLSISASELLEKKPLIDTRLDLKVYDIADKYLAGEVKLFLMDCYEDETEILILGKEKTLSIPLTELDRQKSYAFDCSVFICGKSFLDKKRHCAADLTAIIARLTAPDGCPWDKEQTHESIRVNLIEEAYEAVDAITEGDAGHIEEELGDCLLQTVLHADISRRTGEFTFNDIVTRLVNKLIFRHPHVFGDSRAKSGSEALDSWEKAKQKEKEYATLTEEVGRIPQNFSALLKLQKVLKKIYKKSSLTPEEVLDLIKHTDAEKSPDRLIGLTALYCAVTGRDAEVEALALSDKLIALTESVPPDEIIKSCKQF